MKFTLPTLLFFLGIYCCRAQPSKLVYWDPKQLTEIGGDAGYFVDSTNELSYLEVAQIPDTKFLKIPDKIINLGFSPSRIWFKFDIQNRTDEVIYALFLAQDIDYIDAYVVSEDTTYFMETGALRPFERRYFSLNSVVLNLGKHPKYLYVGLKDMNGLVSQIELGTIRPLMN
ncbi:7TM-DISM domain-containing protein [Runella sp.]|jgi:hypothetical protein|uniref:7TMR-DISMED2 domain-containing protein n=1 Tax=Runella sp. TaxID=1960881 RepID=UPI003019CC8D